MFGVLIVELEEEELLEFHSLQRDCDILRIERVVDHLDGASPVGEMIFGDNVVGKHFGDAAFRHTEQLLGEFGNSLCVKSFRFEFFG